jgi:hypothetical protein
LPATSQIEACWRDEDESRVQLATTTQQMIEAHEVLAICGDERPTQTRHAGEEAVRRLCGARHIHCFVAASAQTKRAALRGSPFLMHGTFKEQRQRCLLAA